jgi:hypothetical protein
VFLISTDQDGPQQVQHIDRNGVRSAQVEQQSVRPSQNSLHHARPPNGKLGSAVTSAFFEKCMAVYSFQNFIF